MAISRNKVGIVTMVGSDNYGNALQNYAVQTLLEQAGYEARTLLDRTKNGFPDSAFPKSPLWRRLFPSYVAQYLRTKGFQRYGCKNDRDFTQEGHRYAVYHQQEYALAQKAFHEKFEIFRREMLHWDEAYLDNTRFDRAHFDEYYAFVCGSDQVWAPHFHTTSSVTFLQFAPSYKRIALSPSFGTSQIPGTRREIFAEWLKGIPYLSVREEAGADIIRDLTGRQAKVLLDPTLALTAEQWRTFSRRPSGAPSQAYIFCYFLGNMSRAYRQVIEDYATQHHCAIVDILDIQDLEHYAIGPQEFVWLLDHAEAVFTDSFHGTAFAINLQRPFIVFERMEGGASMSSRITSILKRTGLKTRKFPLTAENETDNCDFSQAALAVSEGHHELQEYLTSSLADVGKHHGISLPEKSQCTGCGGCVNACSRNALRMEQDAEGFLYPRLDASRCVICRKCESACPVNRETSTSVERNDSVPQAFWAYTKDNDICSVSSSGGVFSLLAKKILSQGGVVFGVGYDKEWKVVHRKIQDFSEIPLLRTSKYVQSDTDFVYREVEEELKSGRQVLFTGTPCQIAALKKFLGKEYDNLWTQDIICHGVPSPGVWKQYLQQEHLSKGCVPTAISFRDKTRGWNDFSMRMEYANGNRYICPAVKDNFESAFLANLILRPSCYHCQFKTLQRVSDLTLADYWGVELVHPELKNQQGVSLVLTQTAQGQKLFESIQDDLCYGTTNRDHAVSMNSGTLHSVTWHPKRKLFFSRWHNMPLAENIAECLRVPFLVRVKKLLRRLGSKCKRCLKFSSRM